MKKQINNVIAVAAIALTAALTQSAHAITIDDNYWGASGGSEVIGVTTDFGITSMDVVRVGNTLNVSINTNFAGKGDDGLFSGITNNNGIGYGDLFLSSTWTPCSVTACSEPYKTDDHSNGTLWTYGFSLTDRYMAEGTGTGTLYSLNGASNDANAKLSNDFITSGFNTYRNGQEVAVDVAVDANGDYIAPVSVVANNSSSWDVDSSTINFEIDLTGTSLLGSDTIALHWGMTCANDTIEGIANVPEPAILGLLALGLIGIGVSRRKNT